MITYQNFLRFQNQSKYLLQNIHLEFKYSVTEDDTDEDVDVEGLDETPDEPLDKEDSEETKTIEIEGLEIVQKGQYSKCPKCEKFIKSTFIIRLLGSKC